MLNFRYEVPTAVLFGKGQLENLAAELQKFSPRILLIYGEGSIVKTGLHEKITGILNDHILFFHELSGVKPNPRVKSVRDGVALCREHALNFILAVGGGSVIDCAKHIAASVTYDGDPWELLIKKVPVINPLPVGAVLTLAATGSEMNGAAVISNDDTGEKLALIDPQLRPKFAVLDPELTYSVSKKHTAAGVADIMSHVFEQYFTHEKGTEVSDYLAEAILKVCVKYGPVALDHPDDYDARANLMWASSLALNGLLQMGKGFGDWATHSIEHELSAYNDMVHGVGLAILTPSWMNYILDDSNANKFASIGRNVFGVTESGDMAAAEQTIRKIREFFSFLGLPVSLKNVGIDANVINTIAEKTVRFGGYTGLFRKLTKDDVSIILRTAL